MDDLIKFNKKIYYNEIKLLSKFVPFYNEVFSEPYNPCHHMQIKWCNLFIIFPAFHGKWITHFSNQDWSSDQR